MCLNNDYRRDSSNEKWDEFEGGRRVKGGRFFIDSKEIFWTIARRLIHFTTLVSGKRGLGIAVGDIRLY